MTDTMELIDIDASLFEARNRSSECEADGAHPCTVVAVAFGKPTCMEGDPILVCKWIVDWASNGMTRGANCGDCNRKLTDCWVFTPI